jgi:hypothetical protein
VFRPIRRRLSPAIAEVVFVLLCALLAWHFVSERSAAKALPAGDEGSWMSVAAELSKGNGFTTRWLEHAFLTPYTLPRPDDYRYPGLTCLLAVAFRLAGTSYATALGLVGVLLLLFGIAVYLVVRRAFGRRTACATLPLVYFSLLQLMYGAEVYTEGLFGIGIAIVLLVSCYSTPRSFIWWPLTGISIGLLYLIRPNAVLFAAAFFLYAAWLLFRRRTLWRPVAAGIGAMAAVMLPWLLRSWLLFGNPFHLAGSAGLLRTTEQEPLTYGLADFARLHGVFYFVKATVSNASAFFSLLHEQEHGLELVPLLFCAAAVLSRRAFFNGMAATAFLFSLFASFYTSAMGNWAGVRYFSPFLPFVYAYGISWIFRLIDRIRVPLPQVVSRATSLVLVTGIVVSPIVYPHRYYERFYAAAPHTDRSYSAYYSALHKQLEGHPFYYAGKLAQINFATGLNCVGMQFFFNGKELSRAQRTFHPRLMALTPEEFRAPYFAGLMNALKEDGCTLTPEFMPDSFAVFVDIK